MTEILSEQWELENIRRDEEIRQIIENEKEWTEYNKEEITDNENSEDTQ